MGNGSLLEGMARVSMFLPPVSVDGGADAAKAGPKVKTADAPAASVSIFLRLKTIVRMGQYQTVKARRILCSRARYGLIDWHWAALLHS
jgi:hypothetical protein